MSIVVDSSALAAVLLGERSVADQVAALLDRELVLAPAFMPVEVTNVIRRNEAAGKVTTATANRAFADLLVYPLVLLPYEPFARRVWELRRNVTSYDAWYVAIAEYENAELVTLDARLARASGPICTITVPT